MHYTHKSLTIKTVNEAARSVDVVASTSDIDSHGEIVEQSWNFGRYAANAVVLLSHDHKSLPIGRAENLRVEGGELRCRIVFAPASANPEAEKAFQLVKGGFLKGVSVGFWPGKVRTENRNGKTVDVLSDNTLLEISLTALPSNPRTLTKAHGPKPTHEIGDLGEMLLAAIDADAPDLAQGDDLAAIYGRSLAGEETKEADVVDLFVQQYGGAA